LLEKGHDHGKKRSKEQTKPPLNLQNRLGSEVFLPQRKKKKRGIKEPPLLTEKDFLPKRKPAKKSQKRLASKHLITMRSDHLVGVKR